MREILFRGKRLDNREWVYGYPLIDTAPCFLKSCGKCKNKHDGSIAFILAWDDTLHEYVDYEVDPATVGQYTGLTDKNGKKIFEGDIVQTPKYGVENGRGQNYSGKDNFSVGYADGTFMLVNKLRLFCLRPDAEVKIIGDRWDNQALLEEAQHDD